MKAVFVKNEYWSYVNGDKEKLAFEDGNATSEAAGKVNSIMQA